MTDDVQARLLEHAARDAGAPFLLAPGCAPASYGSLAAHIAQVRERFAEWGIARGDIVVAPAFDRALASMLFASVPAAATIALVSEALAADACSELVGRMRARAVIVPAGRHHALALAARASGVARIEVEVGGDEAGGYRLELADAGRTLDGSPPLHPPSWAYVGVTSGTTDRPKLVPYGHRSLVRVCDAMGRILGVTRADTSGLVTPIHLANGQRTVLLLPAMHGGSVLCLPDAGLDALIDAIRRDALTYVSASFTIFRGLLERVGPQGTVRSSRLRFLRVASGSLAPHEIEALERAFGVPVVTGLATTETGVVTHQALPPAPRAAGGVGWPLVGEVRLADPAGREVPPGEIGEVQVRGPQVFDGYLDDDDLDARSRVDGWFRLGDLARADASGELFLVGRAREVVNRGGDKISPLEVDAALRLIPGIVDAAAFGVPHPTLGQEIVAAVVLAPDARLTEGAVAALARDRLGVRRAPRRIWFVDALPRNEAGKVMRLSLPAAVGFEAPESAQDDDPDHAGRTSPLEAALAGLWCDVLEVASVRPGDAFRSLGGDDARAARMLDQVHAVFGVELPPAAIDGASGTLAGMAGMIEQARHRTRS